MKGLNQVTGIELVFAVGETFVSACGWLMIVRQCGEAEDFRQVRFARDEFRYVSGDSLEASRQVMAAQWLAGVFGEARVVAEDLGVPLTVKARSLDGGSRVVEWPADPDDMEEIVWHRLCEIVREVERDGLARRKGGAS